jgi:hypothetical protein
MSSVSRVGINTVANQQSLCNKYRHLGLTVVPYVDRELPYNPCLVLGDFARRIELSELQYYKSKLLEEYGAPGMAGSFCRKGDGVATPSYLFIRYSPTSDLTVFEDGRFELRGFGFLDPVHGILEELTALIKLTDEDREELQEDREELRLRPEGAELHLRSQEVDRRGGEMA